MSIGKFFILAILLPMATIYLTLTLKGQKDNIFSFYDERQPQSLNSLNFSSNTEDKNEVSGSNFYYEEGELSESYNETLDEIADSSDLYETEESFESIEDIIKFKKTKTNQISNNDDSVESIKKNEKKVAIINKDQKLNESKPTVGSNVIVVKSIDAPNSNKTVTSKKNIVPATRKTNTKKVNKNKTKITKKKIKPAKSKQNKTAKIKQPTINSKTKKVKPKSPRRVAKKTVKSNKTAFIIKKPKKQIISPKTKVTRVVPAKKSKVVNIKFIEPAFDEDSDYEEDEIIATDTVTVKNTPPVETNKQIEPERFSSDPCSGRSSRYIARCRKR
jgi:hypothetical protein